MQIAKKINYSKKKKKKSNSQTKTTKITSPALSGVKIRSEGKPVSRANSATGEGINFLPLSLLAGGCVTIAAT
jgi:hypothetical protein